MSKSILKNQKKDYKKKSVQLNQDDDKSEKKNRKNKDKPKVVFRSSRTTVVFKYFLPIIWLLVFIVGGGNSWSPKTGFGEEWSYGAPLAIAWMVVWQIIKMLKLRKAKFTRDLMIVKRGWKQINVPYSSIQWVSQVALFSPTILRLKYCSPKSGKMKIIWIIPGFTEQLFKSYTIKDGTLSLYIQRRILDDPVQEQKNWPSKWRLLIIFLTPFVLILVILKLINVLFL